MEGTAGPQGALGTPSALHRARSPPSQHSPNTQASAIKTTPNKHAPNTLTTRGGRAGGGVESWQRHSRAVVVGCSATHTEVREPSNCLKEMYLQTLRHTMDFVFIYLFTLTMIFIKLSKFPLLCGLQSQKCKDEMQF